MVRIVDYDTGDVPESAGYEPPVASKHDRLLRQLASTGVSDWAHAALVEVLSGVAAGRTFERIAVTDAWVEDADTFCLVYYPPWGERLVGHRRQRGDYSPDSQIVHYDLPRPLPLHIDLSEFDYTAPADPVEFADTVVDDIGEPLGTHALYLRVDANGLGWWGTLDETLPTRPASLPDPADEDDQQ